MLDFTFNVVDNAKLDLILKEMKTMSAELDRLTQEVEETKTAVDSALTLIDGLAEQVRNLAPTKEALTKFADELDAKQAAIAAAITANTPEEPPAP